MIPTILVTYATKYGSTKEVAESIAESLRQQEMQVEIAPARQVRSLDDYSAVVLGAALYMGRWHKEARRFLKRHRAALSRKQVAIFALGPLKTDEKDWQGAHEQLVQALAQFPWLTPVDVELFGGVINPEKLHFPFNHMPAGDARDWEAIHAWASKIGTMFSAPPVTIEANTTVSAGNP